MLRIKTFCFNPFSENTYLLYNEKGDAFLIDPGNWTNEETDILQKFISEKELKIRNILLTHAHIDHVLGLQKMYDIYQVPVLLHVLEKEILDRNPMDANRFGFSFMPFSGQIEYVKEGEVLYLGDEILQVFHVPGHSPGSIAYYSEKYSFVISGDVLFDGSIGRTDLYKGDMQTLFMSIETQLFTLPKSTVVYPGHGSSTTIDKEKNSNPFFV